MKITLIVSKWALEVSAVSSLVFALIAALLMKLFGMRFVFVSSYVVSMLQTGVMTFCHTLVIMFVLLPLLDCHHALSTFHLSKI